MAFQLIHTVGGRGIPHTHTHTRDTEATGTADTRLDTALSILRVSSEMGGWAFGAPGVLPRPRRQGWGWCQKPAPPARGSHWGIPDGVRQGGARGQRLDMT